MAQTKQDIRSLLDAAGTHPRQQFGQNFMIDQNLVRLVAAAGEISAADIVIEVGPGTGTLTEELLAHAGRVVAVEIDRDLARLLRERFEGNPKFQLIEGDALAGKHAINADLLQACGLGSEKWKATSDEGRVTGDECRATSDEPRPENPHRSSLSTFHSTKLVANLPYNIASPLVIELLIAGVDLLAFTVQKEVGDRFKALANSDDYGPLSVMAQMLGEVEVLRTLPPQAFWPAPKIESALVRIRRRDRLGVHAAEFSRFVQKLFSARRKTLRKAMAQAGLDADSLIAALKLDPQARPETLSPDAFWAAFQRASSTPSQSSPPPPAG